MKNLRAILAALLALLALVPLGVSLAAGAKSAPRSGPVPGAVAFVGGRPVEEADIRRAALVMESDPLRKRQHALWRKKLLDLCADRERLALEAERLGLPRDAAVNHGIELLSADILYAAIKEKRLLPEITPSAAQVDTARAGGLFRRVKMALILSVTDRQTTNELIDAIRHGASFDSIAAIYSVHPSGPKGGEVGWKRVGELNAASWAGFKTAKPGDIMGPYANAQSHEFYRVEAIVDPDDREIRDTMMRDRLLELDSRYRVHLLQSHHFQLNPDQVSSVIFASATEKADSILASLDSRGRRSKRGVRPSLGVIARADGDSITYRDLAYPEFLRPDEEGKSKLEDSKQLLTVCSGAMLPRLIVRDARERGIDREPSVARRLRLIREEVSTRAMVARAVPRLDSTAVRAYFHAHTSRYRRPAARRALVAVFASEDTARMALPEWNRREFRDSLFIVEGFRRIDHGTAATMFPRFQGEIPILETDTDPLSTAVRGLDAGRISPVVATPNGYAIAKVIAREAPRAFSLDEVRADVSVDAREDAENAWVTSQLEHLRAATPARTVPAQWNAVRLGVGSDRGGNRR